MYFSASKCNKTHNDYYVSFVLLFDHLFSRVTKEKFEKKREIPLKRERQKDSVCTADSQAIIPVLFFAQKYPPTRYLARSPAKRGFRASPK